MRVSLIRADDLEVVGTLRIPELKPGGHPYSYHRDRPAGDQRLWLDEDHDQLIIIPESNDRVVIHKLPVSLQPPAAGPRVSSWIATKIQLPVGWSLRTTTPAPSQSSINSRNVSSPNATD